MTDQAAYQAPSEWAIFRDAEAAAWAECERTRLAASAASKISATRVVEQAAHRAVATAGSSLAATAKALKTDIVPAAEFMAARIGWMAIAIGAADVRTASEAELFEQVQILVKLGRLITVNLTAGTEAGNIEVTWPVGCLDHPTVQ